jgi:hypothetical protein
MTALQWTGSVAVAPLATWMLLLTVKHVIADFLLQTAWIAKGKDAREGWLVPLTVHCLIHFAIALALIGSLAPRFWWLALLDFVIHFAIDRTKGFTVSRLGLTPEQSPFWWAIGIDQALHHLTDFAWALMIAAG